MHRRDELTFFYFFSLRKILQVGLSPDPQLSLVRPSEAGVSDASALACMTRTALTDLVSLFNPWSHSPSNQLALTGLRVYRTPACPDVAGKPHCRVMQLSGLTVSAAQRESGPPAGCGPAWQCLLQWARHWGVQPWAPCSSGWKFLFFNCI